MVLEVALIGLLEELCLGCSCLIGDNRSVELFPDFLGGQGKVPVHQWVEERRRPFPVQSSNPVRAGVRQCLQQTGVPPESWNRRQTEEFAQGAPVPQQSQYCFRVCSPVAEEGETKAWTGPENNMLRLRCAYSQLNGEELGFVGAGGTSVGDGGLVITGAEGGVNGALWDGTPLPLLPPCDGVVCGVPCEAAPCKTYMCYNFLQVLHQYQWHRRHFTMGITFRWFSSGVVLLLS